MVAKISTGSNMFGAVAYNQNKVDSKEAKVLFSNRMLLGEDGNFSIGECMRAALKCRCPSSYPPRSRYFIFP